MEVPDPDGADGRTRAAWRSWLAALAGDAEAALAAGLAYESLPGDAREAWLSALADDLDGIEVPRIAVYAPLLGVEKDPARRERMTSALRDEPRGSAPGGVPSALRADLPGDERVCAVIVPVYLAFVELLLCKYRPDLGLLVVEHEPFCHRSSVMELALSLFPGTSLHPAPLEEVVLDLAHAVVADRRGGRAPSSTLARFAHIFSPSAAATVSASASPAALEGAPDVRQ